MLIFEGFLGQKKVINMLTRKITEIPVDNIPAGLFHNRKSIVVPQGGTKVTVKTKVRETASNSNQLFMLYIRNFEGSAAPNLVIVTCYVQNQAIHPSASFNRLSTARNACTFYFDGGYLCFDVGVNNYSAVVVEEISAPYRGFDVSAI